MVSGYEDIGSVDVVCAATFGGSEPMNNPSAMIEMAGELLMQLLPCGESVYRSCRRTPFLADLRCG